MLSALKFDNVTFSLPSHEGSGLKFGYLIGIYLSPSSPLA